MASLQDVSTLECGAIAMVPKVEIISEDNIEGGMRTITNVELSINLSIRNILTDVVFNSLNFSLRGYGYSIEEAKRDAILSLDVNSPLFYNFIKNTKERIILYYDKNTSTLIAKANTLASQHKCDEALALLSAYPETLKGYPQVANTIKKIFTQLQTHESSQILLAARAALAKRDFQGAAELASCVDATSSCASEAKVILNSIKQARDKEYKDEVNLEKQRIASQERMTKASIQAARDIAKAYYQRQTIYYFWW